MGIEIVEDKASLKPFDESKKITGQIMQKGLEMGVSLPWRNRNFRDIICLGPAFTRMKEELMVKVLKIQLMPSFKTTRLLIVI